MLPEEVASSDEVPLEMAKLDDEGFRSRSLSGDLLPPLHGSDDEAVFKQDCSDTILSGKTHNMMDGENVQLKPSERYS